MEITDMYLAVIDDLVTKLESKKDHLKYVESDKPPSVVLVAAQKDYCLSVSREIVHLRTVIRGLRRIGVGNIRRAQEIMINRNAP